MRGHGSWIRIPKEEVVTWDEGDIGRGSVMLDLRHAEVVAVDDMVEFYF